MTSFSAVATVGCAVAATAVGAVMSYVVSMGVRAATAVVAPVVAAVGATEAVASGAKACAAV